MDNVLVKNALAELKEANIRITPQRYAILEYLIENHTHPTADEIYRALEDHFPNMSVATVTTIYVYLLKSVSFKK